ncbi:hypothetical protein Bca52824_001285 [Brassica carinata]|uniref:Uncharacterized protein n=1 Tax=Brassica carinata TaxID=52824 RepID=A0A8X7WJV0_BRACI|nr:hypothetical protein Bca52824_001285 [Brassica carinata]
MAAEIGISLCHRAFEELTSVSALEPGLYSVKMRPSYNISTGHPVKTTDWQHWYFFVRSDEHAFVDPPDDKYRVLWKRRAVNHPYFTRVPGQFFDNARALVELGIRSWPDIIEARICRSPQRIDRGEHFPFLESCLDSRLPCPDQKGKKRSALFSRAEQKEITRALKMRDLPDLSAIIMFKLGEPPHAGGLMRIIDGFGLDGTDPSTRDDQLAILPTVAETSTPVDAGRKRPRDGDLEDQSGELNATIGDFPDTPVAKKKKKSKKKGSAEEKNASVARGVPQLRDDADSDLPPRTDPSQDMGVTPQGALTTGQEDVPSAPKEVDPGIPEPRASFPADSLIFRPSYIDVVRQRREADDCVDALIAKYDSELKASYVSLGKAQEEADQGKERIAALEVSLGKAEIERDEATRRAEASSMHAEDIASKLKSSRVSAEKLRKEKEQFEREKAEIAEGHAREELLTVLSAEALHDEAPAGVCPHGSNVRLVDTGAVADLQASEHRSVFEGHEKDSTAVLSDNMEEEEVSDFGSDDGRSSE